MTKKLIIKYGNFHIQLPKKRITKELLKKIFVSLENIIYNQDYKKGLKQGVKPRPDGSKPAIYKK